MKYVIIILTMLFGLLIAQSEKQKAGDAFQDLEDSMTEMEDGKLTLHFFNALTGETIHDATVLIDNIGEFTTDLQGRALFPIPEKDGSYGVMFKKDRFITSKFVIEIDGGTMFYNNRFSISPVMDLKYLRVVVDWGKKPKDLDAHMVKHHGYHISYQDMKASDDGFAVLDRDDRDGYGPETITIKYVDNSGSYKFYVHDYSNKDSRNSDKLAASLACVKVFGNGQLLHIYYIPQNVKGIYWHVFDIENGQIFPVNSVSPERP